MSLHRRGALSLATALLTGGCLGSADTPTENCSAMVIVATEPLDPVAPLAGSLTERERAIVADGAAGAEPRVTTYRRGPFPEPTVAPFRDSFYHVLRRVVDSVAVPAFEMYVSSASSETTAVVDAVAFDDLPAADRRALRVALLDPSGEDHLPADPSVDGFPAPYPDGGDESRLVGRTSRVHWQGRTLQVTVADAQTGTIERATYEYGVERVARDAEGLWAFLDETYLIDLTDVPDPQRQFVASAADGRSECYPLPDAFEALRDRLDDRAELPEPYGDGHERNWYVALEGERRLLSIHHGV